VIRAAGIALKTYLAPMTSTRAFKIGGLIFLSFLLLVLLAALVKPVAAFLAQASLDHLRKGSILPGVPLAALLLSEIPIRDGIRHRTLLYPLLGPVSRPVLALVRTLATAVLVALAMTALWILVRLVQGPGAEPATGQLLAIWLGSGAFVGMFGLIHVLSRRGLLIGLAYYGLFDDPLARLPFALRNLSVSFHMRVLAHQQSEFQLPIMLTPAHTPAWVAALLLIGLGTAFVAATAILFKRKPLGELC
jgi:ABC-2 type transport system permease protein